MLVRIDRLRRLEPPKVASLPSELATDLPSSLIVSVSGSWKRTTASLSRGAYSETGLTGAVGRCKVGLDLSYVVALRGNGVENADRAKEDLPGNELFRFPCENS